MSVPAVDARFSPAELREARRQAEGARGRAIEILEERAALPPQQFLGQLALTLGYVPVDAATLSGFQPLFDLIGFRDAGERRCIAMRDADGALLAVTADPLDAGLAGWVETRLPAGFSWRLAHRLDLQAFLSRYEETLRAMDSMVPAAAAPQPAAEADDLSFKRISEHASPVVKLVDSTLYDAVRIGASDIHLETGQAGLSIKYRVDGVLTLAATLAGADQAEQILSRVKVMAELDIAERRVPQDGRFKVTVRQRQVDFRVSIMPSIFGEDAVLRILDKQTLSDQMRGLRLDSLGFDPAAVAMMRRLSGVPYGMVLVTGPTGSGKTTTLYAAIAEINHGLDKIITIEDPVEYQLPGVLQIPVNEKKGLSFARGLRSILRHDPDKIMVGEIRDAETAQIAVQSALTGHLVFTTVHANNVFDVIGRFMHMGVDPYSFVSALNGVIAQRLLRVNCPACARPVEPDPVLLAESGIDDAAGARFMAGHGCGECRGTGFRGRRAIGELLLLNDEIRELIVARAPLRLIREAAERNGTRQLRDIAVGIALAGHTTLQEINRVTFVVR
ncbi:general secretion pathway protein GspE [Massilia sp. WF1]|uniref:GspE/PulE family protein n=1 Tax=unclassified Massilia TaxID=2609279 RepID=UPI00064A3015|nr:MULTISPECIES: GspE/PulE family protein [unclassified Massilia]ALK97524.1 general secretion pathway protein GspE [Massilia sp. WG5]KLU36020.1 general secretion pathway protein GspE [Massilia sp. WF1]